MKSIIVHIAYDGSRFDDQSDCERYERQCDELRRAIEPLGEWRPRVDWRDNDYVQHDKDKALLARGRFLNACLPILGDSAKPHIDAQIEQVEHNQTFVGRLIDDSMHKCMRHIWFRFMSMDPVTGREYSQPYYAIQAAKAREQEITL